MSGGAVWIPFASTEPLAEAGIAETGTMNMAPRADHQHPRLTATSTGVLNASGEATITFTRTFPSKPGLTMTYAETADGQPVVFKVKTWTVVGSDYTGCVIKGYRAQAIPTNLATLLLGGVFNLFSGSSATGVEFSLIAVQASQ